MVEQLASRLETFFREETSGALRSIVKYEMDDRELTFVRDDVAEQYNPKDIDSAVNDSRMESFSTPIYKGIYTEDHGEIICLVKHFENVVEMNFVLDDGVGTVVALDVDAMDGNFGLVSQARKIVEEERQKSG